MILDPRFGEWLVTPRIALKMTFAFSSPASGIGILLRSWVPLQLKKQRLCHSRSVHTRDIAFHEKSLLLRKTSRILRLDGPSIGFLVGRKSTELIVRQEVSFATGYGYQLSNYVGACHA